MKSADAVPVNVTSRVTESRKAMSAVASRSDCAETIDGTSCGCASSAMLTAGVGLGDADGDPEGDGVGDGDGVARGFGVGVAGGTFK